MVGPNDVIGQGIRFDEDKIKDLGIKSITELYGINYDTGLLDLLSRRIDQYPVLLRYYLETVKRPAMVLTPVGMTEISNKANTDSYFFIESMDFLDTIALLDIMMYGGDGQGICALFLNAISKSRENSSTGAETDIMRNPNKGKKTLSRNDLTVSSDEIVLTLAGKREILAFYIFAHVCNYAQIRAQLNFK